MSGGESGRAAVVTASPTSADTGLRLVRAACRSMRSTSREIASEPMRVDARRRSTSPREHEIEPSSRTALFSRLQPCGEVRRVSHRSPCSPGAAASRTLPATAPAPDMDADAERAAASRCWHSPCSIASRISRAGRHRAMPGIAGPRAARRTAPGIRRRETCSTMPPLRSTISTSTSKARSSRCTTSSGERCARGRGEAADVDEHHRDVVRVGRILAPALSSRSTTCGDTC